MDLTVAEALARLRRESRDESEKGRWFENLVIRVFRDNPEYEIDGIWRWADWPKREKLTGWDGRDWGIDLVALHRGGGWIAIQCKCYADDARVSKPDIDSFLGATQQPVYSMRWIVATCDWTKAAEGAIEHASPPVRRIDFLRHLADPITEDSTARPGRTPWPRQQEAIDKVVSGLKNHDRARLTMACGTGKTFVSLRIAETAVPDGGRILLLAPSIALVSQARREWLRHTTRPLDCRVVCSDRSAGGRGEGQADIRLYDLECPVTSDPNELADLLIRPPDERDTRVVFCTYQSLRQLTAAQQEFGAPPFDLVICDEAHRTTGVEGNVFQAVHDDKFLNAAKRLYMTATPRIYTRSSRHSLRSRGYETVDMSDLDVYGRELDFLSFRDAVEAGLLSDYRVIVLGVHDRDVPSGMRNRLVALGESLSVGKQKPLIVTGDEMMRLLGTSLAINGFAEGDDLDRPSRLYRTIAFANSINRSKFFAEGMKQSELRALITRRARQVDREAGSSLKIEVEHLDGSHSAFQRNRALRELRRAGENETARVLCNVKLFGEGVDVPSLDAVVFMEPRDSQVDIVQAVGRVMRRSEGKRLGYVVVPIPIPPGEDLSTALSEGTEGYKALGQVLRALQSHDGRLAEEPYRFVKVHETAGLDEKDLSRQEGVPSQMVLDLKQAGQGIYAHVVAASGLGTPGLLVADEITAAVRRAAAMLFEGGLAGDLAAAMSLTVDGKDRDICTIAALLVANACLLHRRLRDVPHMAWLDDLAAVSGDEFPAEVLTRDWEKILEQDYRPVFEPAVAVLHALPRRRFVSYALCILAECANRTATSLSDLGYDHAGPLYHRILPNADATGSFYTNNISALLLARLAIDEGFVDWQDEEQVRSLRIMDPACGTGTLLMAAMNVLKSRTREAPETATTNSDRSAAELHKSVVETVIYGLDINLHAVQLAACNLTLGAPTVDYQRINLYTLKHGPQPDGSTKAGSLEILYTADSADSLLRMVRPLATRQGLGAAQIDDAGTNLPTEDLDLVIMNPPFTNNVKRGRQYSSDQVKRMQQYELSIRDHLSHLDHRAGEVIDANSISTFFTPLADRLIHPQSGGTLAKVLPATGCVGASGLKERVFLADRFHIERIITSHDPKRINFSENTSIHECLLVARRLRSTPTPETEFISLRTMPRTPEEAIAAAEAITAGGPTEWGNRISWPAERVRTGDWTPVQWYSGVLVEAAYAFSRSPHLEPIGLRHTIGPAGQRIRDAFRRCDGSDTRGAVHVFWSVSSKLRKRMGTSPEEWAYPKPVKKHLADRYWQQRSHLMVAALHDTVNGRLTALWSDKPTVGSGWVPAAVSDHDRAKALAAWWNSTPARLMLLNQRTRKLTYVHWSLAQLRKIRVPKPDNPAWSALGGAWEEACDIDMLPLFQGEECAARRIIDRAAAVALGIDEEQIADLRRLLADEPTISNQPAP